MKARAAGIASVVVFFALVAPYWHPVWGFTAFLRLDATNDALKIAAFTAQPVYVYPGSAGYDGLYYAQLAYDPGLKNAETRRAMDNAVYRARRILPPLLAWIAALGQPAWIVHTYSLLNVVAWCVLAATLWGLLGVRDAPGVVAWIGVLFSAGALASVRLALTDLVALSLLAGAMYLAERLRPTTAAWLTAAALLARETSLLAVPGVLERPWVSRRNGLVTVIAIVPLLLWLAYVRWALGPGDAGWSNLTVPFTGLFGKLVADVSAVRHLGDPWLAWTTAGATAGLLVQAIYIVTHARPADGWWRLGAAYVLLLAFLSDQVWEGFPGAATRVLLPMTLAFNVLASRRRVAAAWLVAGNLAVPAGVLAMRDVPRNRHEMAAGRVDGAAVVVRTDDRWLDVEADRHRVAAWGFANSALEIETWPKDDRPIVLTALARSREPRLLTIVQDGIVLWRSTIFDRPLPIAIRCHVRAGRARIELSAQANGHPESTAEDTRSAVFSVQDVRIVPGSSQPLAPSP